MESDTRKPKKGQGMDVGNPRGAREPKELGAENTIGASDAIYTGKPGTKAKTQLKDNSDDEMGEQR